MDMRSLLNRIVLFSLMLFSFYSFKSYWGFQGHKAINNKAVFSLPPDLFPFYKENIEYITEHSIDPDKRRHTDESEAPRHYLDADYYVSESGNPFDVIPQKWNEAVDLYSEDTLLAYGIVPWQVLRVSSYLSNAFKDGNREEILRLSAELGHYVADACVPLHSTLNYDGQLTDQKGIHSFWETRLVELYIDDFDLICDKAFYIENQREFIWEIVEESHADVARVLLGEKEARSVLNEDEMFIIDDKSGYEKMLPSERYSYEYYSRLDGMVERRMRRSINAVSSFWFTAWVNAGQPDISKMK